MDEKLINCLSNIIAQLNLVRDSTIIVLIHYEQKYTNFEKVLFTVLKEEKFEPFLIKIPNVPSNYSSRRIAFKNNSNQIKILTLKSIQKLNPQDLVRTKTKLNENFDEKEMERFNSEVKEAWKQPLFTLIYNMPEEFYGEEITIENCEEILNKYKQYIKL